MTAQLALAFAAPRANRRAAREAMQPRVALLRDRVLAAITAAGTVGLTADETAARIAETPWAVRPRVTELYQAGLILPTDCRRTNASGRTATVWRAA